MSATQTNIVVECPLCHGTYEGGPYWVDPARETLLFSAQNNPLHPEDGCQWHRVRIVGRP